MTLPGSTRKNLHVALADFVRGCDENNLAEFPLTLLTESAPRNQKTLEFQDTIKDWQTGKVVTRRVCITGSDKFGLPTAKDDQVLTALLQLTAIANNFSDAEVSFTKHQIIELLDWGNTGWAYKRVEQSLHRWKGVSVHYWNAWRDHGSKTWTDTEAIGVIDYFRITDGRRNQDARDRNLQSRFVWNRELFKSFQSGYMKPLNFGLYRSLKRPAARRAFRFLDKRFHHRPDWEFDLQSFACEKLGFSRNYDIGQLKARLNPAMAELAQVGFIEPISYRKGRPKTWSIIVSKKLLQRESPVEEVKVLPAVLVDALVSRGVARSTAEILVAKTEAKAIKDKVQYLDWLISRKDKRVPTNTAGFLVAAIRDDYPLPKDFLKTREPATRRVRPFAAQLEPQSPPPQQNAVECYLATLSDEELTQLESDAVQAADQTTAQGYVRNKKAGGATFQAYRSIAIRKHVERLLSDLEVVV